MKKNFRNDARHALERARAELDSQNPDRLKYAALELRMAVEALTYSRALAYKDKIPPQEYQTWQPKKLMKVLLEFDPNADKGSTLNFGVEEEPGKPAKEMKSLGTEVVFDLAALKKHYDALGAYLHMPSLKQVEESSHPDLIKLRDRCEAIAAAVEAALASPVSNITLGNFSTIECMRCNKKIRKRFPLSGESIQATCFECGAEYNVSDAGPKECQWTPLQQESDCPTENCDEKILIWKDEIKVGTCWTCPKCSKAYKIGLAIVKDDKK